ncbi:MAG: hypothetical protein ACOC4Y_01960, partial [bacterium]
MKNTRIFFIIMFLSLLFTGSYAQNSYEMDVTVKIDYGGTKAEKNVKVKSVNKLTALEALQYAA